MHAGDMCPVVVLKGNWHGTILNSVFSPSVGCNSLQVLEVPYNLIILNIKAKVSILNSGCSPYSRLQQ